MAVRGGKMTDLRNFLTSLRDLDTFQRTERQGVMSSLRVLPGRVLSIL